MAKVIDVPGMGPTLFSPVLAHSLEKGDLIAVEEPQVWRVTARPKPTKVRGFLTLMAFRDSENREIELGFLTNEPVWRAVGARAGGVR